MYCVHVSPLKEAKKGSGGLARTRVEWNVRSFRLFGSGDTLLLHAELDTSFYSPNQYSRRTTALTFRH
jgi:hypothetical protein